MPMFKPEIMPAIQAKTLPGQDNGKPRQRKLGRNVILFFENMKGPRLPGASADSLTKSDRELVEQGNNILASISVKTPTGLKNANSPLYFKLYYRGLIPLLDCARVRAPKLSWEHMSDDELINYTKAYAKATGITWISELIEKFNLLVLELRLRGITDKTGLKHMESAHVERAKVIKEETGIKKASELLHIDPAFYDILQNRNLFEKAGLEVNSHIDWESMSKPEIVNFVKEHMRANGIPNLGQLTESEHGWGMYVKLKRLGLREFFKGEYKNVMEISEQDILKRSGAARGPE